MSAIFALLAEKRAVPERMLLHWCMALDAAMPVVTTQFLIEQVMPLWRALGQSVLRREEIEPLLHLHPTFASWLRSVDESAPHVVIILTANDDRRCVVLLDRQHLRAELINRIDSIVPEPLCDELASAILWLGRLATRRLFTYYHATRQPLDEPWNCTASAMCYLYFRLQARMQRESAGRELNQGALAEFIRQMHRWTETRKQIS